ncbi:LAMI_0F02542g1_1 [Lachancea mirantina]|uniref:LAMI_0F02542g1_1 n=1 Tax=Lachancea mirantina TaxID=1230905 RepID=A0A1G4JWK0_9SACH|nr:LAMI_0F02542g1_1 [Lachancea mirantina]
MPNEKHSNDAQRLLKLISVSFKEASLDSPSFRASVNFYHVQVESIEGWIVAVSKFLQNRFLPSLGDFKQISDTLYSQTLPPPDYLYNGLIENQLHTPSLLDQFHKDLDNLSNDAFELIRGDSEGYMSILSEMLTHCIEPYRESRRNFEYYQSKHDSLLAKYQSVKVTNPNLEPSSIREDAFQLFEVRKSYLQASLDLKWEISKMEENLDDLMIRVVGVMIRRSGQYLNVKLNESNDSVLQKYTKHQNWSREILKNNGSLSEDMRRAKDQIQQFSINQLQPSRDLEDYTFKNISQASLLKEESVTDNALVEKYGWLYMKTAVGKPSRQVWVRRWCFLKNSLFGLFLLSPSKTSVEETDKFGVLLTSARYCADEDRKFCFEIKIAGSDKNQTTGRNSNGENISVIFQAETLAELKSWLLAFEGAKRRVLQLKNTESEYKMAFSRFPPTFYEFSCSSTSQVDHLLTTYESDGNSYKSILQMMGAAFSESGNVTIPLNAPFDIPLLKAPIMTKLTKLSILSSYYVEADNIPNAIMANFWGSVNWGRYCFENQVSASTSEPDISAQSPQSSQSSLAFPKWNQLQYPDYFYSASKNDDIEFRTLFESALSSKGRIQDLVLMKFSCSWSPNTKQGFCGSCFITMHDIYFYMNSMGFIFLLKRHLTDLVSVEATGKTNHEGGELIDFYDMKGLSMRVTVFFDDAKLLSSKIQLLLKNGVATEPGSERSVLNAWAKLQQDYESSKIKVALEAERASKKPEDKVESIWTLDNSEKDLRQRQQAFQIKYARVFRADFDISATGLMHIMFGNKSRTFPRSLLLAERSGFDNTITPWYSQKENNENITFRRITFKLNSTKNFLSSNGRKGQLSGDSRYIDLTQKITRVKEGYYYEADQESGQFQIPFTKPFSVSTKFIIISQSHHKSKSKHANNLTRSCSLFTYYKITFAGESQKTPGIKLNYLDGLVRKLVLHFCRYEFILCRNVISQYLDEIGNHGKTIKAIKLCGQLGLVKGSSNKDQAPAQISVSLPDNVVRYSKGPLFRFITKWTLFYVVNAIFTIVRLLFHYLYSVSTNVVLMNRTILLMLLFSVIMNLILSGRTTASYWSAKRAEGLYKQFIDEGRKPMERALYIRDLDLLSSSLIQSDDACFSKFLESTAQRTESKYHKTRQELAIKRNELLVELKILASMERELVHGDFLVFLQEEVANCQKVETDYENVWKNDSELQNYCLKCRNEYQAVRHIL